MPNNKSVFCFALTRQLVSAVGEVILLQPQSDYNQYILSDIDLNSDGLFQFIDLDY
jgi:hypothetical protein